MPSYQPVTQASHGARRLRQPAGYQFAATQTYARLLAYEMAAVLTNQPMAFVRSNDEFVPVAVQSLHAGRNLYVSPDGRWLAGYLPAVYRLYPFILGEQADGRLVLCVDEDSDRLSDTEGEPLFDSEGRNTATLDTVVKQVQQFAGQQQATARVCEGLARHQLLVPWEIKLRTEGVAEPATVQGLYRVDETALNALPDDAFLELRRLGALQVAWCQLLSMRHLPLLQQLADGHGRLAAGAGATGQAAAGQGARAAAPVSLDFLSKDGPIDLGGL